MREQGFGGIEALEQELTQGILDVANNYGKDSWRKNVTTRLNTRLKKCVKN